MTSEETERQYVEIMGPELGSLYHRLWRECAWLHLKWNNFEVLFGTKPERIDLLNLAAPVFFNFVQDTVWEDILLHICRLMDPANTGKKCNLTLSALPNLLDSEARREVENLLKIATSKCAFARDWRDRRIAHRDRDLTLKKNAKPLAIATRRSVKDALQAIGSVLNVVELQYTGRTVGYEHVFPGRGGAEALLYVLRDGVEAEAAQQARFRRCQPLPEDLVARPDI
jgi:AbiU2